MPTLLFLESALTQSRHIHEVHRLTLLLLEPAIIQPGHGQRKTNTSLRQRIPFSLCLCSFGNQFPAVPCVAPRFTLLSKTGHTSNMCADPFPPPLLASPRTLFWVFFCSSCSSPDVLFVLHDCSECSRARSRASSICGSGLVLGRR